MSLTSLFKKVQQAASDDLTLASLRTLIVLWAVFIIVLTFSIKNKWILAGILAYEILP